MSAMISGDHLHMTDQSCTMTAWRTATEQQRSCATTQVATDTLDSKADRPYRVLGRGALLGEASEHGPGHRRGQFHRHAMYRRRCWHRGEQVIGIDNLNDYYVTSLKQARLATLTAQRSFAFQRTRARRSRRPLALRQRASRDRSRRPSRRSAGCALFGRSSARLYQRQCGCPSRSAGSLPPHGETQAFRLCQLVLGLRRQHQATLRHRRRCRPAAIALRRHQEGGRADELLLRTSLQGADDRSLRFFTVYGPWGRPEAWRRDSSPRRSLPASRSSCLTTAGCGAISPMSTISSPA